jgi:hypothetical protein
VNVSMTAEERVAMAEGQQLARCPEVCIDGS